LIIIITTTTEMATSFEEWIKQVDTMADDVNADKEQVLKFTKEGYDKYDGANNPEILWRMARSVYKMSTIAEIKGDKESQKKLLFEADDWVLKALAKDADCAEAHTWRAYICGKLSDFVGNKERIERGNAIQTHIEAAIKLKPKESGLYHTYGRWCLEVAKLSWLERKLAATLFGAPPEATYEDAVKRFKEADELKPDWKCNNFYMAKSYINLKNYKEAIKLLDLAAKCESKDEEDLVVEPELAVLQKKYASYR
jgi:tetratricopeptide (TPR) repeat protein